MQNAKLDEAQAGIKIVGRNINNLWTTNSKNINNNSAIISFILWEKESHNCCLIMYQSMLKHTLLSLWLYKYMTESWTIKKAEYRRIDAFELWCWRVPWTAKRPNQSILKEISPEYSLEGLMLKLKLQYFGHLMWRTDSIEKDPDAGKNWRQEDKRMAGDEMVGWHHWLSGHEFE